MSLVGVMAFKVLVLLSPPQASRPRGLYGSLFPIGGCSILGILRVWEFRDSDDEAFMATNLLPSNPKP